MIEMKTHAKLISQRGAAMALRSSIDSANGPMFNV